MPDLVDWTTTVEAVKASLAAVETAATAANIPPLVMEELKSAVDHCRTTLWAALLAAQTTYEGTSAIVAARMNRVQEMCGRIREDVAAGRIGRDTPGIAACHASLADTGEAFRLLFSL
jgi:hypothetical protein